MNFNSDLCILRGEVQASMKNRVYNVEVNFDDNGDIIEAKCNCTKGIKCHHIAALLLFGHHNISVTDRACIWNVPKRKGEEQVITCDQMFPAKPYKAVDREINQQEIDQLREKLNKTNIGLAWILIKEPTEQLQLLVPQIEDIVFNELYFNAENKYEYLRSKLRIDEDTVKNVVFQTTGQSENENWMLTRKHRLTASNFGPVLNACRKHRFPPSLFKRLHGVYNLDGVKSVQWGKTNEKIALEEFFVATNLPVTAPGIWLHTSGFLGASPDGLIQDNTLVEVKCPFTYRNDLLFEVLKNNKNYIIYFDENEQVFINEHHHYYDQIQGLLHIVKRDICHLVVWTLKETVVTEVQRNDAWKVNLQYLENFYLKQYIYTILRNKE